MADIDDRWYKTIKLSDGTTRRHQKDRYGSGKRWQARWRDEAGRQRKRSFDRKADAERFVAQVKSDLVVRESAGVTCRCC
jgi:hypothetical protein